MAILINMEMSNSCRECIFCRYSDYNAINTECVVDGLILARYFKAIEFEGRAEECPLREIVFCKDCAKHNKAIGDYDDTGKHIIIRKKDSCPLVLYRGKAYGHEFDYQFCACGKRKENGTD